MMGKFKLVYAAFPDLEQFRKYLPGDKCFGFAIYDEHGYTILIDSSGTEEQRKSTLRHELAHLVLNHLEETKPLFEINSSGDDMFGPGWIEREHEADKLAEEMSEEEFTRLMMYAESVRDAGALYATR